jgi:hypothetical protein
LSLESDEERALDESLFMTSDRLKRIENELFQFDK